MSTNTTPNPVTWFEIHSADPARARQFYGDVFGWTYDEAMPGYSMIQLGPDAPIAGGIADSGGAYPDRAIFLVQVPDVGAALTSVAGKGGSVVTDVQTTPVGLTFGYATDPDGSIFGVWCPPPQA
jgi:predicted enzyme related to lactoylglutathione lyase